MKRLIVLPALFLVAMCSDASAQSEGEALVTATVENELVLLNVDGDWGLLSPGTTYVITPGGFKEPPGPGEGAGIVVGPVGFEVDGGAGLEVFVSLLLPAGLLSDDESGSLPCSNWTFGWNYDNDPSAAFADAGPVIGGGVRLTIGGGSASGLFLGATVSVPPTAFTGTYTGQIIGSVAYTGN